MDNPEEKMQKCENEIRENKMYSQTPVKKSKMP